MWTTRADAPWTSTGDVYKRQHKQLTGTARFLAEKINREVGCKTRAIEFNSLQRCASHIVSRVDITEDVYKRQV